MVCHWIIILTIIVIAGLLGGITNHFMNLDFEKAYEKKKYNMALKKSILLSMCASITVPLFLQVISNNLLDFHADSINANVKGYFIFMGFCIIAALFSKRFLEDLYSKVKNVEEKLDNTNKKIDEVEEKNQEYDDSDDIDNDTIISRSIKSLNINDNTNENIKKIINAIVTSKYTYRTEAGIAKETNIPKDTVVEILNLLKIEGSAASKKNSKGNNIWKFIFKE